MAHLTSSASKIIPKFKSTSISNTIEFYTKQLHFTIGGVQPGFCSLFIGKNADANIYFFECSAGDFHASDVMIALDVAHLDEFYRLLVSGGAVEVVEKLEDKEWGYRQFMIKDDSGNLLTFFRHLEGEEYADDNDGDGLK